MKNEAMLFIANNFTKNLELDLDLSRTLRKLTIELILNIKCCVFE